MTVTRPIYRNPFWPSYFFLTFLLWYLSQAVFHLWWLRLIQMPSADLFFVANNNRVEICKFGFRETISLSHFNFFMSPLPIFFIFLPFDYFILPLCLYYFRWLIVTHHDSTLLIPFDSRTARAVSYISSVLASFRRSFLRIKSAFPLWIFELYLLEMLDSILACWGC